MLDIGAMELFVVAILALVVVGPKELPKLLRTIGGLMRKARELTAEFRDGVETLAAEAEREIDPFAEERKEEGIKPGMSPEDITSHIMGNREHGNPAQTDVVPPAQADKKAAAEGTPKAKADEASS